MSETQRVSAREHAQDGVMVAVGLGIQKLLKSLDEAQTHATRRDERATANLDQLDRIALALFVLADELDGKAKVSGPKLAERIRAIREGRSS